MHRRSLLVLIAAATLLPSAPALSQESFPNRPIRIVVPYAPGGATDIAARIVADRMRHIFNQSVVVENKPGAFGIIAIEEMLRAKPDGHTLMVGNPSTNVITPIIHEQRMSVDYDNSVVLLSRMVDLPSLLIATKKDFPPTTVQEVIAYAKANPGKVRYGSAGLGSFPHYGMEVFARHVGIEIVHIPNKGGGAAYLKDIMIGDLHIGTMNVATAAAAVKAGNVRPLAVTEETRLPQFPDLPSYGELGLRRPGSGFWHSLFAPAATPRPVLEVLHKAVLEALNSPEAIAALDKSGMRRIPHATLDEGFAWMRQETELWRKITSEIPIDIGG